MMKVKIQDTRSLGQRPTSQAMKKQLAKAVSKRADDEMIIVHHYADRVDGLLLVLERRSASMGLKFENLVI